MIDASEASHHRPATFVEEQVAKRMGERVAKDPFQKITGMPPGGGQPVIPHAMSFQGLWGTHSKVYLASDEALRNSSENARFMRNDCGIMECVEARQRVTALLDWVIEPEDANSQDQKELCTELTRIVNKIRRFTEYRMNLMHAVWFGRYGIQHTYGWAWIGGKRRVMPKPLTRDAMGWLPIHGDKLVFRYDDGNRMSDDYHPDQLGIRCTYKTFADNSAFYDQEQIEATGTGLAYFLTEHQRQRVAVHKHMIEDAAHDDGVNAGTIHGVGIRSRIYWDWFQKQEALAFLMEYLERSAGGIEVWTYPAGDDNALLKAKEAAKERLANGRNVVFFPKPPGEDGHLYDIQVIEPGMAGIEALKDILQTYFGHRIKRYILGQTLSSEAQATGLGSGLAELHLDTLLQIVKYDSGNLEETITHELITYLKNWNFPKARGIDVRFRLLTERANVDDKLEAMQKAYQMGARLAEADVMEAVGARMPDDDDYVLQDPQIEAGKMQQEQMRQQQEQQAAMMQQGGPTSVGMGGHEIPPAPEGAPSEEETADAVMQAYYGDQDAENAEPGAVVYANEAGEWQRREIPAGDTGERRKAGDYSKWNESDHPRDDAGRFAESANQGKWSPSSFKHGEYADFDAVRGEFNDDEIDEIEGEVGDFDDVMASAVFKGSLHDSLSDYVQPATAEKVLRKAGEIRESLLPNGGGHDFAKQSGSSYVRIHAGRMTDSDLHQNHKSKLWAGDGDERSGLSVVTTVDELVDYFAGGQNGLSLGRGATLKGAYIVELEGNRSGDKGYDAGEGEHLIHPRKIVQQRPVSETNFVRKIADLLSDGEGLVTYDSDADEFVRIGSDDVGRINRSSYSRGGRPRRYSHSRQWNESDHPRDGVGRFAEHESGGPAFKASEDAVRKAIDNVREKLRPKLAKVGLEHKLADIMDGVIEVIEEAAEEMDHPTQKGIDREMGLLYSKSDIQELVDEAQYMESDEFKRDRYRRESAPLAERIEAAAKATETDPSEAQRKAGNYPKGKFWAHALEFSIENPKGSTRSGKDKGGKEWSVEMQNHYGYVLRHEGADGDQVDVFIGASLQSELITVIDQYDKRSKKFDEHKCFVFFPSRKAAEKAYRSNWGDDKPPKFRSRVLTIPQFRQWLQSGDLSKPIQNQSIEDKGE